MRADEAWWRATLLGGAAGDALGAPVEFLDTGAIRDRYGPDGITELAPFDGRLGAITDDTQMTLFTAEGLLAADRRAGSYGISSFLDALHRSYLRWLATQGEPLPALERPVPLSGMLYHCADLHHRRSPGRTCLAALQVGRPGTIERPLNTSKGCGGVMRAAPGAGYGGFRAGVMIAAITHGHPTGYLAAGAFAEILAHLSQGRDVWEGLAAALELLAAEPLGDETSHSLTAARDLATSDEQGGPETVEQLGEGWTAEEALSIALYCALRADVDGDPAGALILAVNHSGDSDSTGAITGNLVGAMFGEDALPAAWIDAVEARREIIQIAHDLATPPPAEGRSFIEHAARYPYQ